MDNGPNITNELLERMTIVLENMSRKQNVEPMENQGLETFRRNNPQKFKGGFNLEGAQSWIAEIEKIFIAMTCADLNRVTFATFCSLKKLKIGGDLQNNNWRMKGDKLLGKSSNKSF